jgi:hypothetical protein
MTTTKQPMKTTEKLQAIHARCVELLAIAEKRTPGRWEAFQRNEEIGTNYCRITFDCGPYGRDSDSLHGYCGESNSTFIAACAGAAEAGWRATIAAIDAIELMDGGATKHFLAADILAAWKEEV